MRKSLSIKRGRFDLLLPLGEGKLTRAYLAIAHEPAGPSDPVVVKRLRPELAGQPHLRELFLEAARVSCQLEHPCICRTTEVFSAGDEHFFVMEYLEGQTLADLLRRIGPAKMPIEEHLYILSEALAGLAYVHSAIGADGRRCGGNHREVNATNIMITYAGDVKLVDFALSQTVVPASVSSRVTIGAAAPEQFCGLAADARSDVFALGVLLWEALARRRRAEGDSRAAMVNARVTGREARLGPLEAGIPDALAAVCERATALDPEARYATAADFLRAFELARAGFARPVGSADLAALVSRNFQLDRTALRRRIEQHLGDALPDPPPAPVTDEPSLAEGTTNAFDRSLSTTSLRRRTRKLLGAAVAAAAIGATAVVLLRPRPAPRATPDLATRMSVARPEIAPVRPAAGSPVALPGPTWEPIAQRPEANALPSLASSAAVKPRARAAKPARPDLALPPPVAVPEPAPAIAPPPATPRPSERVVREAAPARAVNVEPGMNLAPVKPAAPVGVRAGAGRRELDEQDPYR